MLMFTRTTKQILVSAVALALQLSPIASFARDTGIIEEGAPNQLPEVLDNVSITQKVGDRIDLGLKFFDENGQEYPLAHYFDKGKPVILSLAYFNCPNLCNWHLNGMKDMLKNLTMTPGKEFQYLVVSIEPKETPELAKAKQANYIKALGRLGAENGWHFLTTPNEANIKALADQVGFAYHWDAKEKQWAHASSAQILTPDGVISRYFNGVLFDAQTVRLSLVEAGNGVIGNILDRVMLFCFHYDPKASKYTPYVMNVMRGGAILIVLVLIAFMLPFWFRQKRQPLEPTGRLQGET